MKEFKKLVLIIGMLLMTSCGVTFKLGSHSYQTNRPTVKTYTNTFDVIKNLDPHHFGLHYGGNWILCRHHGFHDLNDWSDFTYSPYSCRVNSGFIAGARWNSAWNFASPWNNRYRFNRYGFNDNWTNSMYYGWNNYYNQGWPYYGNNVYGNRYRTNIYYGRRATNQSGRWESTTPVRRVNPRSTRTIRTNTPTRVIRTNTPTKIKPIKRTRTNIPSIPRRPNTRTIIKPINNKPKRTNTRSTRSNIPRTSRTKKQ